MSERTVYEYAVVRVVPRVEREEFVNVGVALYCRKQRYADVKIYVDETKIKALYADIDVSMIDLTTELRPHVPLLLSYHSLLTKLDFVRAKALFAIDIQANMPILTKEAGINLVQAKHPLLLLNAMRDKSHTVVPLNIKIDDTDRIILVSGPNAGGKSVCMKTVGLLQLMLQSGLLI